MKAAVLGGLFTAIACYPRLLLWTNRPYPLWYLEATIVLGTTVLWAFVFAWHKPYTSRPVFTWRPGLPIFIGATIVGIVAALAMNFFLDPILRSRAPADYPANWNQWCAMTLFTVAFSQLFLLFAPFAWLVRLFKNGVIAGVLTVAFGVFVLAVKAGASPEPYPLPLLMMFVLIRVGMGFLAVYFYLRGGVLTVWWLGLLLQARHLPHLGEGS